MFCIGICNFLYVSSYIVEKECNFICDIFLSVNRMLSECCRGSREFELYKCDNTSEVVYDEIRQLVSFYEFSNYKIFPYANAKKLYWHKKL